jgi:DNA-binding protein H-NS
MNQGHTQQEPIERPMTKTYAQVMKQIQNLSREADTLKRKEVAGVIDRIKEAINAYGLNAADLGLTGTRAAKSLPAAKRGRKPGAKSRKSSANAAAKFRNEQGQVWGGRGPRPKWLREAINSGKQLSDFAV